MFALIGLAFIYVLLRSLSPDAGSKTTIVDNLSPGQTAMRRLDGRRVWISHLSAQQKKVLNSMPENMVTVASGCQLPASYCIIDAASERAGIELVYSKPRPSVMLKSKIWVGGFIDPDSGAIYDLLGRAYKRDTATRTLRVSTRL